MQELISWFLIAMVKMSTAEMGFKYIEKCGTGMIKHS